MRQYITDSLAVGIIWPSALLAGDKFLFVERKDKMLQHRIDYRGLNQITIKNMYPLPFIDFMLEQLYSVKLFSKLDLRSDFHTLYFRSETGMNGRWLL